MKFAQIKIHVICGSEKQFETSTDLLALRENFHHSEDGEWYSNNVYDMESDIDSSMLLSLVHTYGEALESAGIEAYLELASTPIVIKPL